MTRHTTSHVSGTCRGPARGVRSVTCLGLGTDTTLRHGCENAQAHRAGALITVLGGLRADREESS